MSKKIVKTRFSYPLGYKGNLFFFVLFLIFWFPLGVGLALKNGQFVKNDSTFYLLYKGGNGWLFLWWIFFFPIAVLLMLIKGVDLIEERCDQS